MAGTRWVRLDVDYFHNPKVLVAGRDGRDLHLASICWVADHMTDGHIPAQVVPTLLGMAGTRRGLSGAQVVDAVCGAGLWIPNGSGFHLHDFVAMNGSRVDFERERARWRANQRAFRARRDQQLGGET